MEQCPVSAINREAYNWYIIVKECNNVGMGGGMLRPSLFYSEANIYFEVRGAVNEVLSESEEIRELKRKREAKRNKK